jgi:hypothetical protein
MESPIGPIRDPAVSLHDFVNKLAVIIGHCDLLADYLKAGSPSAKHVTAIKEIAQGMAAELAGYKHRGPKSEPSRLHRCSDGNTAEP